jgi:hypothetical protein
VWTLKIERESVVQSESFVFYALLFFFAIAVFFPPVGNTHATSKQRGRSRCKNAIAHSQRLPNRPNIYKQPASQ